MSLDFSLESAPKPKMCYHCDVESMKPEELFSINITHNLGEMADKAGVYQALWRPDENGFDRASDIIQVLTVGLSDLVVRPEYFKQFDASNGWGTYEHFVPFVEEVLTACKNNPDAFVRVSR